MAKPKLLGVRCARLSAPVKAGWETGSKSQDEEERKAAKAQLKRLVTWEARCLANPLTAGEAIQHDRWPKCLKEDYGDVPNLFRFELSEHWRGLYTLVGEPGGVRVHVLYLVDHPTYDRMFGYAKK